MKTRIRVCGKDQNRTALGIINAYLKLYPNATLEDLQKAFPYSLNPVLASVKQTVVSALETVGHSGDFFDKPEDLIILKDGQKAALKYLWRKDDFQRIEEHAKQYGIEAINVEETAPFHEGSYRLEMVEEYPEAAPVHHHHREHGHERTKTLVKEPEKKKNNWWWLLLALLLLLLALLCWKKCCHDKPVVADTEVVPFTDTEKVDVYEPYWDKKIASATVNESGDLIFDKAGELVGILIDSDTVRFDKLSTEAEIYQFLMSDAQQSGWIVLDDVHFKFGGVNFTPAALAQIQHITAILNKYAPDAMIALEGFSDHLGTQKENQSISDERAVATKGHFIADGLAENKITSAQGLSDTQRLCQPDDTPLCRALNRRVEIKLTK